MKAARFYGSRQPIRVEDVPVPDVGPGEVLIRVLRAGTNGGDVGLRKGVHDAYLPALPMTLGHEGCGEIVEVGPGVRDLRAGDRVIAKPTLTCGSCKFCRTERQHLLLLEHTQQLRL